MYPPRFDYFRASSITEAMALLGQHEGAKLLAGGQSLIPTMNLRLADPGVVIDIGRIVDLRGISSDGNGGIRLGTLTTFAEVMATAGLPTALSEAAGLIGDPQVRNRGTVGGNVCHADPASDLPPVMLALGATFHISGPKGSKGVAADEFFVDLFTTALAEDEILTAISIPAAGKAAGSAYVKFPNPASRYALVSAAALVVLQGDRCETARIAIGGATPKAIRAFSVEAALTGQKLEADTIAAAAEAVQSDLGDDILGDIHASAEYRRQMATVFVKRAVVKAAERVR